MRAGTSRIGSLATDQFKGGFDHFITQADRLGLDQPFNYQLQFRSGAASQIAIANSPVTPDNSGYYLGVRANNSLTIGKPTTMNLGVRYAYDDAFVGEQCAEVADCLYMSCTQRSVFRRGRYAHLERRIAAAHAWSHSTGDGKTAIKGGWGRFPLMRGACTCCWWGRNVMSTTLTPWRDLNNN